MSTYEAVEKHYQKGSNIGLLFEQGHGDERILGKLRFAVNECEDHEASHDKQSNDLRRVPWEQNTSEVESKEEHQRTCEERKDAEPVNGLHAINEGRVFVLDVQEN